MAQELEAAQHAWERGDYAQVRRLAQRVLESEPDENARRLAQDLVSRTRHDRAAIVLGVVCILFFLIVFASYAGRN